MEELAKNKKLSCFLQGLVSSQYRSKNPSESKSTGRSGKLSAARPADIQGRCVAAWFSESGRANYLLTNP